MCAELQVPSDRRALFESARRRQREKGNTAGAEFLFSAQGLHPKYWGVSKKQLEDFREKANQPIVRGRGRACLH